MRPLIPLICIIPVLVTIATAADWPHYRGPAFDGISSEDIPGTTPKPVWKAQVGIGFSSFAVADGRVFTLGWADEKDTVFAFDAARGKELWKHSYDAEQLNRYYEGGPSATPAVDEGRIYTLSKWGEAFCFDAKTGSVIWTKHYAKDLGIDPPEWGFAGSPLISGGTLYLNIGSRGLAADKATGTIRWSSDKSINTGYSTPVLAKIGTQQLLLIGNGLAYLAVDPATGTEKWNISWFNRYGVNAADPIVTGQQLFISTGYGKGAALFDLSSAQPVEIYKSRDIRTQMNPCILIAGHLYGIDGDESSKTALKCLELATGKVKWQEPTQKMGSVIAAKDKLIVLGGMGELTIAKVSTESFDAISTEQILSGKCWTVPVLSNGKLYARNADGEVVCLDMQ